MATDPQIQVVLDLFDRIRPVGPVTRSVEMLRAPNPALMDMRWPSVAIPVIRELMIPRPDADLPARLYAIDDSSPRPTVVYFHGGGWVAGSIETHDGFCRNLVERTGCTVLSVDYRLAPEHPFPAAVDDAIAVVQWAGTRGHLVGIDAAALAVAGDSAGGNLAAVVPRALRDQGGPELRLQILLFPITDHEFDSESMLDSGEGFFLTADAMRWYWAQYLNDPRQAADPRASPLRATDLSGLPPAMILAAEHDPLRTQAERYASRLVEAGVATEFHCFEGMIHSFANLRGAIDRAEDAMGLVAAAVQRHLGAWRL